MCSSVLGPAMPPPLVTCPTSSTAGPASFAKRISRAAHCRSRVDFPMPGSPPTNTTDPGTIPPPKTKSNSRRPVCHRRTAAPSPRADRRTGGLPDGTTCFLSACLPVRPTASSTSVFHAPHASQRPPHLGCSAPQSVQRNTERSEEHTSELQSPCNLVCRLLLEKK